MPIYAELTELEILQKHNQCSECGEKLDIYFNPQTGQKYLACHKDENHIGLTRPYEPQEISIERKVEDLKEMVTTDKALSLVEHMNKPALNKIELGAIINTIYPNAPMVERTKAIMLCLSYKLNPLSNHVFLIPFGNTWTMVMGIRAKQLLASRRGPFSYIDGTPRIMTPDEQVKTFGLADTDRIWVMTKLKDTVTGAESVGYGFWLNSEKPKGESKGNTRFNMASIRSESQALDRLRPGEMPSNVEAIDETIAGEFREVKTKGNGDGGVPWPDKPIAEDKPPVEQVTLDESNHLKRDPTTIIDFGKLYTACREDWPETFNKPEYRGDCRKAVWKELGYNNQDDISESPVDCYLRIAEARLPAKNNP